MDKQVICYTTESAADWGGASRVLFTNLKYLNKAKYRPIVLLPADGPIISQLRDDGVDYVLWGKPHELHGLPAYIHYIIKSLVFFHRNNVKLLHLNNACWRPAEVVAARILGIPIVSHYHLVPELPGPHAYYSKAIVVVSAYVAKNARPNNVRKVVIHNSVALDRYDSALNIREELGLDEREVVVAFVGQILEKKGIDLFVRLGRNIAGPGIHFIIVGECRGPDLIPGAYSEARLQQEIGDNEYIKYLGYRRDIQNIYHSSDIIVVPSRWEEPFGLVNIEAGASRKPVVAISVGGIPEIIRHGETGFLVPKEDLEAMRSYVRKLIADPKLRKDMGDNARAIVVRDFTSSPVRKLERLYDELIG